MTTSSIPGWLDTQYRSGNLVRTSSVRQARPAALKHLQFSETEGTTMNQDTLEGNWLQLKGKAREQWGKLTDDDLDVIAGKRDQLAGKLQERYGIACEAVEQQIKDFEARYPADPAVR